MKLQMLQSQKNCNGEKDSDARCQLVASSGSQEQARKLSAQLIAKSRPGVSESVSGPISQLESPTGGSRKSLTSGVISSATSFSDGQLLASQGREQFPVTTSVEIAKDKPNIQPTNSSMFQKIDTRKIGNLCEGPSLNTQNASVTVKMPPETTTLHGHILKHFVVFSNIEDQNSIIKIFHAANNCVQRCPSVTTAQWAVPAILFSLKMEENLLAQERVCVFLSLLLHNFSVISSMKIGNTLNDDSCSCLDSFSKHIYDVMADIEAGGILSEFLEELLSLLQDLLSEQRVLFFVKSSETSESHLSIPVTLNGENVALFSKIALIDHLVAGSAILAAICTALDRVGFIREASFEILHKHSHEKTSVPLTILHVFAYIAGEKMMSSGEHDISIAVLKSIVTFLENRHFGTVEGDAKLHPGKNKCPFSDRSSSLEAMASMLMEMILEFTQYNNLHQSLTEFRPAHKDFQCVLARDQSVTLCDILSLVELIACYMVINLQMLQSQKNCNGEKDSDARCQLVASSGSQEQARKLSAQLIAKSRPGVNESVSGPISQLESPTGGSRKSLTSGVISSATSFSDGQLLASQGREQFSVTTSVEIAKDKPNIQPTNSSMFQKIDTRKIGNLCEGPSLNTQNASVTVKMPPETTTLHGHILKHFVVFSNIEDQNSIIKIFHAANNCVQRCPSVTTAQWAVPAILFSLKMEENLLAQERVCVFLSLLLHNFSVISSMKIGNTLNDDSCSCLDSFSKHIYDVMADIEAGGILSEFLEELLSRLQDLLSEQRVFFCVKSSETSESHLSIPVTLNVENVALFSKIALIDHLVAGSAILAAICTALDRVGFIREASFEILHKHSHEKTSVPLTILHVFAYIAGEKMMSSCEHDISIAVLKSIVMFLENRHFGTVEGDAKLHPGKNKCPFSDRSSSLEAMASMLMEMILEFTQYNNLHQSLTEFRPAHKDFQCVLARDQSVTLCDILSLVELIACYMAWDWTSANIVAPLLKILGIALPMNLSVAIVSLLGQLISIGVDAGGYENEGISNLREKLSAFLQCETTLKAGFAVQIATVSSLLKTLQPDFSIVFQGKTAMLPGCGDQSVSTPANLLTKWFMLLSDEQRDFTTEFLQTSVVR